MATSSSCITTSSSSWLIRLVTLLSTQHNDSTTTAILYEKQRPCPNPKVLGIQLSPTFEMVLSFVLPVLLGLYLGTYFVQKTSSLGKKSKSTTKWKWPLLSWIRSVNTKRTPSRQASFDTQELLGDNLPPTSSSGKKSASKWKWPSLLSWMNVTRTPSRQASLDTQGRLSDLPSPEECDQRINVMKPSYRDTVCESGIHPSKLPKHIAVIMDGNRRYGKRVYGVTTRGHHDGGKKAAQFIEWCHTEGVPVVTLFAFSTENWNRSKVEVDFIMTMFEKFGIPDLRALAHNRKIRVNHFFTEKDRLPASLLKGIDDLCDETKDFEGKTILNICLNYGGRHEIINASKSIAQRCLAGEMVPEKITEDIFAEHLTTRGMPEPELMIRTSGEYRLSNFLLWQLAYAEFFFTNCDWPELEKTDLLSILREYAEGRKRRFGR